MKPGRRGARLTPCCGVSCTWSGWSVDLVRRSSTAARPQGHPPVDAVVETVGDSALVEFVEHEGVLLAITVSDGRVRRHEVTPLDAVLGQLDHLLFALRRLATGQGREAGLAAAHQLAGNSGAASTRDSSGPCAAWSATVRSSSSRPGGCRPCRGPYCLGAGAGPSPWRRPRPCGTGRASGSCAVDRWSLRPARASLRLPAKSRPSVGCTPARTCSRVRPPPCTRCASECPSPGLCTSPPTGGSAQTTPSSPTCASPTARSPFTTSSRSPACPGSSSLPRATPRDRRSSAARSCLGLAAAFLSLGTTTLVGPMVLVDDVATARLTVALHERLTRPMSPAAALAAVQADALSGGSAREVAAAAALLCLGADRPAQLVPAPRRPPVAAATVAPWLTALLPQHPGRLRQRALRGDP